MIVIVFMMLLISVLWDRLLMGLFNFCSMGLIVIVLVECCIVL